MTAVSDTLSRVKTLTATFAIALTLVVGAQAAPPNLAALGYTVYKDGDTYSGGVCPSYRVTGYGVDITFRAWNGLTCNETSTEAQMQTFADGHQERKLNFEQPAAVAARSSVQGKGYTVTTDYAGPTFTVTGDCNVNQTVGPAGLATLAASIAPAAPCPVVAPTATPTPTTTEPAPTTTAAPAPIDPAVAELQTKVAELARKVETLQAAMKAAWTALVDALADGKAPWAAALAARSAGLNELYGL